MDRPNLSDMDARGLVSRMQLLKDRCAQGRESGQAMVEFALILFPLLLIVVGIIQFGIGLNYWLDMQRIANQGARWAAVNCARSAQSPPSFNPCSPSLEQTLKEQALTAGLENNVCVWISYPSKVVGGSDPYPGNKLGDPVKVRLASEFDLLPIMGVGSLKLGADATMRMEQAPTNVPEGTTCP